MFTVNISFLKSLQKKVLAYILVQMPDAGAVSIRGGSPVVFLTRTNILLMIHHNQPKPSLSQYQPRTEEKLYDGWISDQI